jgi:Arc/MetJ family transcription regulator
MTTGKPIGQTVLLVPTLRVGMQSWPLQRPEHSCEPASRGDQQIEVIMRTTVNLDEGLLNEAQRLTGLTQRAALIQEGLKALIARESAKRLALLGGSDPQIDPIPRRRPESR